MYTVSPYKGHCFGESYLLTEKLYAVNAVALTDSTIIKLSKDSFLTLIEKHPKIFFDINRYTSERLHFRYIISSFLAISDPFIKVHKLLDHLKSHFGYWENTVL
ncbi:Crp/Fnr family transcriptional regulator [Chryseobacterium arachidis]|uniref:Crp/Fnr family transcriptional regulator n=1 Tax=Chryseobacterium arachidis TaxID=1416778 RepID=UPI0036243EB0